MCENQNSGQTHRHMQKLSFRVFSEPHRCCKSWSIALEPYSLKQQYMNCQIQWQLHILARNDVFKRKGCIYWKKIHPMQSGIYRLASNYFWLQNRSSMDSQQKPSGAWNRVLPGIICHASGHDSRTGNYIAHVLQFCGTWLKYDDQIVFTPLRKVLDEPAYMLLCVMISESK